MLNRNVSIKNVLYLVLSVFNTSDVKSGFVWEHKSPLSQPFVSGIQNCIKHALVEEAVSHPLGDDDVHLLNAVWQSYLLNFSPNDLNFIRKIVSLDKTIKN